jgi:hypothetical protein
MVLLSRWKMKKRKLQDSKALVISGNGMELSRGDNMRIRSIDNLTHVDTNDIKRFKIRITFPIVGHGFNLLRKYEEERLQNVTRRLHDLDEFVLDTTIIRYDDVASFLPFRAQKVVLLLSRHFCPRPLTCHDILHVLQNLKPKILSFIYVKTFRLQRLMETYVVGLLVVIYEKLKVRVGKDVTNNIFELFFCQLSSAGFFLKI